MNRMDLCIAIDKAKAENEEKERAAKAKARRPSWCRVCGGDGWLPSRETPATCPACKGTGKGEW